MTCSPLLTTETHFVRPSAAIAAVVLSASFCSDAHAWYSRLHAKTVSNQKRKEATNDAQGYRVVQEIQTQVVEANVMVPKNEGKAIKVQCYFFASHPSVKGPYLFDVQERTIYGSNLISFTSPDVTRGESHSKELELEGFLDPLGVRIPFRGTATDSSYARGGRVYGWVVTTVVDGVIENVKSNQSGIAKEFEKKSLEAKRLRSPKTSSASADSFQRKLDADYISWGGKVSYAKRTSTIKPEATTANVAPTASLVQQTTFELKRNGVTTGETKVAAGARVVVLEKKDDKVLIKYSSLEPTWVESSNLAYD
jgi:hypothetical protein